MLTSQLSAQENWTLKRCIEHAISHSIDVEQANIRIKDAALTTKVSKQQQYPNLSFQSNAFINFGRSIDPTTNQFITTEFFSNGYGFNANAILYNAGRLKNEIRQSKLQEGAVIEDKNAVIDQITVNVVTAFFRVLFGKENLANDNVQLRILDDQISQLQKLINAGARPAFEVLDLDAQKAAIEQQMARTQNEIDLAFIDLKAVLNLPLTYDMDISSPPIEQSTYTNIDLTSIEEIYSRVLGRQPAARAIQQRLAGAAVSEEIARSQFYPVLAAGLNSGSNFSNQFREVVGIDLREVTSSVRINGDPAVISTEQGIPIFANKPYFPQISSNFNYGVGVNLTMPIYNRYTAKSGVQRAKLNIENLNAEKEKNELSVRNIVGQLYTDAKGARKNLDAAQRTVKARQAAFDNAEKRFGVGAIDSFEYINSQNQLAQAKTTEIIARFDYALRIKLLDFYQGYPVTLE